MKIRVKGPVRLGAPGDLGRPIFADYQDGQEVGIRSVDWPGKPYPHGDGQYRDWSFWTSSDIDCAIIFGESHAAALILTEGERDELRLAGAALPESPFPIEIEPPTGPYDPEASLPKGNPMPENVRTITVHYAVKRSANFQSVDVGMTVEVEPQEGQTPESVFGDTMKRIVPLVESEAGAAISDITGR